jgi:NADH-quinone oxidoreductase subunit E
MLSDAEKKEIKTELAHAYDRDSVCVEVLKVVQAHRGWVSDEALRDVAELLQMTPDELEGVATFYSQIFRQPVGRHVLKVCDSISCWVMGGSTLMGHISQRLGIAVGETTADKKFTLLPICCLGACDSAPALMLDDTLVRNITIALVEQLLTDPDGYLEAHSDAN